MKNIIIKVAAFCLLFVSLYMMFPISSEATDIIDLNKNVTFTLFHEVNGKSVEGVEFSIYRVGDITAEGKAALIKPFWEYGLKLDVSSENSLRNTADTLQGYIFRDDIQALDSAKTDANGVVVFPTKNILNPAYGSWGMTKKRIIRSSSATNIITDT